MKTTNKQTVLLTGGTSGIGYELAKLFAKNGYNLVLTARSKEDLEAVAAELSALGGDTSVISKDLSDPRQAVELYDELKAQGIPIHILVNNAGQGQYGEFAETDINKELSIIQLNISSLVILTKLFLREMLERGHGKILNLSSIASKSPGPLQSVYHGTKAFVQSFTEAIHSEVRGKGITITALLPGPTDTDFFEKADMMDAKVVREGKLGDPATVAADGYRALMEDKDMIVSGAKNKIQVVLSNVLPDAVVANMVGEQQAPSPGPDDK